MSPNPTTENRWKLEELTAIYYQECDCNQLETDGQTLRLTAESNGSGQFLTLTSTRWAVSGPTELQALLADFIGRATGLPLEQAMPDIPQPTDAELSELPVLPTMGPHLAHEYGFGTPAGPYPAEAAAARATALTEEAEQPADNRRKAWSDADVKTLTDLYPTTSNRDIAEQLGRDGHAIILKATALGLKKATAVTVAEAVAAVPLSAGEKPATAGETERILERIRTTVSAFTSIRVERALPETKTRALGLLSTHEDMLPSVKGAVELLAALKEER